MISIYSSLLGVWVFPEPPQSLTSTPETKNADWEDRRPRPWNSLNQGWRETSRLVHAIRALRTLGIRVGILRPVLSDRAPEMVKWEHAYLQPLKEVLDSPSAKGELLSVSCVSICDLWIRWWTGYNRDWCFLDFSTMWVKKGRWRNSNESKRYRVIPRRETQRNDF